MNGTQRGVILTYHIDRFMMHRGETLVIQKEFPKVGNKEGVLAFLYIPAFTLNSMPVMHFTGSSHGYNCAAVFTQR